MKRKLINNSFLLGGLFLTLITVLLMLSLKNQNTVSIGVLLLKIVTGILIFDSCLLFFIHYKFS